MWITTGQVHRLRPSPGANGIINMESPLPDILPSVAVNSDASTVLPWRQEPLIAEISYFRDISSMGILDFQFLKNFRMEDLSGK